MPKTSGFSFQVNYVYGKEIGQPPVLAGLMQACNYPLDSHWPRMSRFDHSWKNHTDVWERLKRHECNFVGAHGRAGLILPGLRSYVDGPFFTFTFLREPIQRALSIMSFGCFTKGKGDWRSCQKWQDFVPKAIRNHGMLGVGNASLCTRNQAKCIGYNVFKAAAHDEGPIFASIQTWYFQRPWYADMPAQHVGNLVGDAYYTNEEAEDPNSAQSQASAREGLRAMDAVLLTEHQDTSICLLYHRAGFQELFDSECRPGSNAKPSSRNANGSPHSLLMKYDELREYANLVRGDVSFYQYGVELFCQHLAELEQATDVAFVEARGPPGFGCQLPGAPAVDPAVGLGSGVGLP